MMSIYRYSIIIIIIVLLSNTVFASNIDEILQKCVESYSKIQDYTCVLYRKELVKNNYREQKNIILKFKKPLQLYFKWTEGSGEGTEVIFVKDKYNNKLVAHPGGFFKFFKVYLDPKGNMAMKNNRHYIYESHIGNIVDMIQENYNKAKTNNEGDITYKGEEVLDDIKTYVFQVVFPENKGYYGHIILINIDKENHLPVKLEVYGWANELFELYYFSQLKINTGLTDMDFDIKNPNYEF